MFPKLVMLPANRPLRVLLLAPFPPRLDASYGGGRAIAQLVCGLARQHEVALLCLRRSDDGPTDPLVVEACRHVEEIGYPGSVAAAERPWRRRFALAAGWLRGRPMWATDTCTPEFGRRARALAGTWHPDIVQIEFNVMSQYLPWLRGCTAACVMTEHDPSGVVRRANDRPAPHGAAWRPLGSPRHLVARVVERAEARAWRRFISRAVRAMAATVVFTESDEQILRGLAPEAAIARIPLVVAGPVERRSAYGDDPPNVLFVGSFRHPPNVDAALFLSDSIFPLVAAEFPSARLYVVGEQPSPELRKRESGSVTVTGWVEDLEPYLDRATVVAAPLRFGGGTRVKVLEALAAGKAVVASRLAVAGIEVRDREHLLIADTAEDTARAIVHLFSDPSERARLADAAFQWARQNLAPERSADAYVALYRGLLK
jgi:glycosyltransferase involved in cell wall biosynthesis